MADKHLNLKPHHIRGTKSAWWYEESKGICLVQEVRDARGRLLTDTLLVNIPWASLRGALKRKDHA